MRPLLIAIGNPLRGDDGVAWRLAEQAGRLRPAIAVRCVQQLTPELSTELVRASRLLFIDAWLAPGAEPCAAEPGPEPRLRPLTPPLIGAPSLPPAAAAAAAGPPTSARPPASAIPPGSGGPAGFADPPASAGPPASAVQPASAIPSGSGGPAGFAGPPASAEPPASAVQPASGGPAGFAGPAIPIAQPPPADPAGFSHALDPPGLLSLTQLLHGSPPPAWELLLPAWRFAHGTGLSPPLRRQRPRALALLLHWCDTPEPDP